MPYLWMLSLRFSTAHCSSVQPPTFRMCSQCRRWILQVCCCVNANTGVQVGFPSMPSPPRPFGAPRAVHRTQVLPPPSLHSAIPRHPAWPSHLSFVSSKCPQVASCCPVPLPPISRELGLVAVGSQFAIRCELTFKEKQHTTKQSNHCNTIDLLGQEGGRCLTFCIIYGRGRSWAVFSHKKYIYFWMQSAFFAMGPKPVFIHWLMVSGDFFPEFRRQML